MKIWLKDPLLLFLVVGALIFWVADLLPGATNDDFVIDITANHLNRLADQWQAQMGRPPSERELSGLVDQYVREEAYYREAMRMSLDQNDVIVRRRLVQKLTFLTEDIATSRRPNDAELRDFYQRQADRYRLPTRYSFRHRYFSIDRREDAHKDAVDALTDPTIRGDPFMLQRTYAERTEREIGDLFGDAFAAGLAGLASSNAWQGPVRSAYGWHLIQLEQRLPEELPPFEQITDKVAIDLQSERRELANQSYLDELLSRYDVRRP